jgi:hypothetical protein
MPDRNCGAHWRRSKFTLQIVKRTDEAKSSEVLSRRGVVEPTFDGLADVGD